MKRFSLFFALVLTVLAVFVPAAAFAGGGSDGAPAGGAQSGAQGNVVKIALIIENTIDDKGWCQAMYDGLVQAQKQLPGRIEFSYSEKMLPVDAGSAARQYASQGYNIIIGHGAQYKNLILEMAEEYPNITFAFGTSAEIGPKNVFTYMPQSEETGYLNGIIAGLITKSGQVGLVGPVDGGDSARYNRGFVLGVQQVNPRAKIAVAHTGSFSDYVKAGEVAHTQIRSGADVLTGSSQQAIGALRAVSDAAYSSRTLWWLGQDLAQLDTPEGKAKCIAASSYNYAAVITGFVRKLDAGIRGGECIPMNFLNDGFVFEYNQSLSGQVSADVRAKVDEALASFRQKAETLDWNSVDYSKL
ncbi:MAG: BMP family protein [Spirochaetaceae bacterium]|nr:BMP family protein [Spirochaetaceae bacterium]